MFLKYLVEGLFYIVSLYMITINITCQSGTFKNMKIFTSPTSRTFNSINRTFSKSFSYDDKSYIGIENADLKQRIIKNSFSRSSNLSSKSYKRNLIYRVSASFIPSCVSTCSFYHLVILFSLGLWMLNWLLFFLPFFNAS